jgi:hypothetical protein
MYILNVDFDLVAPGGVKVLKPDSVYPLAVFILGLPSLAYPVIGDSPLAIL